MESKPKLFATLGLGTRPKSFVVMVGALTVQQLIVASSSFWLVKFADSLAARAWAPLFLGAYLASLIIPYFPGALANYSLRSWEMDALRTYWMGLSRLFAGRIENWSDPKAREEKPAVFVKDGPDFIRDGTTYIYDLISTGMNTVFNIIAVVWLLNPIFLFSYLFGLGLAAILIRSFAPHNARRARVAEAAKVQLTAPLAAAWDNLAIGNSLNQSLWRQDFETKFESMRAEALASALWRDGTSLLLSLAAFAPTLAAVVYFSWTKNGDLTALLPLAVLLPRLFMILNHTVIMVYLARDWTFLRGRLDLLREKEGFSTQPGLNERIQWSKIDAGDSDARTLCEHPPANGWYTLRGANGAGKSTLLYKLKQALGAGSFYYPAKSSLSFTSSKSAGSTGERVMAELAEAFSLPGPKVFLLDEWDANLDDANRAAALTLIKQESQRRLIVDVRHR